MPAYVAHGHVYLVENLTTGLHKVGCTHDLYTRMCALRCESPDLLRLVWHIGTNDGLRLEGWFHNLWAGCCVSGEWFALNPEQVRLFRSATAVNYRGSSPLPERMRDPLRERRVTKSGRRRENVVAVGEVLRKVRRY